MEILNQRKRIALDFHQDQKAYPPSQLLVKKMKRNKTKIENLYNYKFK